MQAWNRPSQGKSGRRRSENILHCPAHKNISLAREHLSESPAICGAKWMIVREMSACQRNTAFARRTLKALRH